MRGVNDASSSSIEIEVDPPVFEVDLRHDSVIVCGGELDLAAAPSLRASFAEATEQVGDRVVLDLTRVTFLDCSALGEVVRARTALRSRGADLTVRGLSHAAERVCRIVGLDLRDGADADTALAASEPDMTPANTIQELIAMWRTECRSGISHTELVSFRDPAHLLSLVVSAVVDPRSTVSPRRLADIAESCTPADDADAAALVVLQLIALGSVLRTSFGDHSVTTRLHGRLDVVIEALVGSALNALVNIGLVDPLTGLRNRRALDQDLVRILAAARRRGHCLSVVMIDVEGLKAVNDRLGHAAGDEMLRDVARNLSTTCRAGDQVYRVGGDEFVLVLPDLTADHIESMMRRTTEGASVPFTWGCAWMEGDDTGGDLDQATSLLEAADRRMLHFRAVARSSTPPSTEPSRQAGSSTFELAGQIAGGARRGALVEQATGMLAQYFGAAMSDAADLLTVVARGRDEHVVVTAGLLVDGTLRAETLASPVVDRDPHDVRADDGAGLAGTTGGTRGS